MGRFIDLTGQKFNRLLVLERAENRGTITRWLCKCDCGNSHIVGGGELKNGNTKSCGCLDKEVLLERNTTHGMSHSPEYRHWKHMKKRCFCENDKNYCDYGAKGITVQDSWVNDFMAFYNHIGPKPKDGRYSIDRIDGSRGYEEGNVRWADDKTQARNTKMKSTNTSGYTGVRRMVIPYKDGSGENVYWQARWNGLDGKRISKQYAVDTYGDELAEFLAIETRSVAIMRQNQIEGNYSENFGK